MNDLTGRSFIVLLKALLKASKGSHVVVIGHSHEYSQELKQRTTEIAKSNCKVLSSITIAVGLGKIQFSGPLKSDVKFDNVIIKMYDYYNMR